MGHGGKFTQKPISLHGWTAGDKMHPGLFAKVWCLTLLQSCHYPSGGFGSKHHYVLFGVISEG